MTYSKTLMLLAALGIALLVGWYVTRESPTQPVLVTSKAAAPVTVAHDTAVASSAVPATGPATPSTQDVANWIADADGGDAGKRAAAITALAGAPKADALPVLRRIVVNGEPQADRTLALRSLRDLALAQGDDDGAIRDAVRQAIYHGDDLSPVNEAQEVLEIIEESRMK